MWAVVLKTIKYQVNTIMGTGIQQVRDNFNYLCDI